MDSKSHIFGNRPTAILHCPRPLSLSLLATFTLRGAAFFHKTPPVFPEPGPVHFVGTARLRILERWMY